MVNIKWFWRGIWNLSEFTGIGLGKLAPTVFGLMIGRKGHAKDAMANTQTRTIRLTDQQLSALEALATKLDISGQRGARFQPFIQWLADTSSYALVETAAALEIAAGCAAGREWDELAETIEPDWPKE